MKIVVISGAFFIILICLVAVGLLFFKSDEIISMGTEKALLLAQSQIEKALPANYPVEDVRRQFNAAVEKLKTGEINTSELTSLLSEIPSKLQDGKIDSTEVNNILERLRQAVKLQKTEGTEQDVTMK